MSRVAIIGTGKLGTRLAEQLVLDGHFDEVLLWNRSQEKLRGTILSLNIWANLLNTKTRISQFDWDSVESLNLIVLAIKEHYDPRALLKGNPPPSWIPQQLRYAGLLRDLPQVKSVCEKLINFRGTLAVVTNPVDIITSFVSQFLPQTRVYGLGSSVDSARLSYIASNYLGYKVDPQCIPVGGEHGHQIVAFKTLWSIDQTTYNAISSHVPEWSVTANDVSIRIVTDLGYTLQDCAVTFAEDVAWLAGETSSRRYAVFSVFNGVASVGTPVAFGDNSIIHSELGSVSDLEREEIENARSHISSLVQQLKSHF